MKIRMIVAGVVAVVALVFLFFYVRLGLYKPVEISVVTQGPYHIVYKDHMGPYHKIVPVIEEVEKWAKQIHLDCRLSFGEYIDNPDIVEEVRLRSRGGCIVMALPTDFPEGFKIDTIADKKYVKATFDGAPSMGPVKIYPKIQDYMKENNLKVVGPILEIYEVKNSMDVTTEYLFPTE